MEKLSDAAHDVWQFVPSVDIDRALGMLECAEGFLLPLQDIMEPGYTHPVLGAIQAIREAVEKAKG